MMTNQVDNLHGHTKLHVDKVTYILQDQRSIRLDGSFAGCHT